MHRITTNTPTSDSTTRASATLQMTRKPHYRPLGACHGSLLSAICAAVQSQLVLSRRRQSPLLLASRRVAPDRTGRVGSVASFGVALLTLAAAVRCGGFRGPLSACRDLSRHFFRQLQTIVALAHVLVETRGDIRVFPIEIATGVSVFPIEMPQNVDRWASGKPVEYVGYVDDTYNTLTNDL